MRRLTWIVACGSLATPAFAQEGEWWRWLGGNEAAVAIFAFIDRFEKLLIFLGLFLLVGLVFRPMAQRMVVPRGGDEGVTRDEPTARRLAIAGALVWTVALIVACEAAGLGWFLKLLEVVLHLVGTVIVAGIIAAAALAVGTVVGPRSRGIALSLLGWYYLKHHASKPGPEQEFDLGDGVTGKVVGVDPLHTTFDIGDEKREMRPNAWLMRTHFGWAAEEEHEADHAPPPAAHQPESGAAVVGVPTVVGPPQPPEPPDLPPSPLWSREDSSGPS